MGSNYRQIDRYKFRIRKWALIKDRDMKRKNDRRHYTFIVLHNILSPPNPTPSLNK